MARPIVTLAVFFLAFSLFSQLLISTGVAATIGIDARIGGQDATDEVTKTANDDLKSGAPTGETLFGMYNVLTGTLTDILAIFNPGLRMLSNAGMPDYLIEGFLMPLVSLIKIIGVMSFLRGWDL